MITFGKHSPEPSTPIQCYEGVNLTIGNYTTIASGLKIYSGTHPPIKYPESVSQYPFKEIMGLDYNPCEPDGEVYIGNDVWIATDVSILEGVTIGDGAIIGARSNVTKNVPPYTLVGGNPAQYIRQRFSDEIIIRLLTLKWWTWLDKEVQEAVPYMKDVEKFLAKYG